ncbi:mannose-1-phosphate guanylyltransferase [Candidatus Woesearchaeota archaeon]|nr:mannose-1-phosphate guanylyltransferase [Candidatus Woesearchaeota archaeon]
MTSAVLLAGGGGKRFWPKSRKNLPKQCLQLVSMNSMIEETVERIKDYIPKDNMYISTGRHISEILSGLPLLKGSHYIIEPMPRDTAAAIGLSAMKIDSEKKDEIIAILPADAYIREPEEYLRYLETAVEIAKSDRIVLIGIKPSYPATGLGYIQKGEKTEESWAEISEVKAFKEKPDERTAKDYIESKEYLWNSGMFITKTSVILDEIKKHMPKLYSALEKIKEHQFDEGIMRQEFERLEKISIDYGVMEKAYDRLAAVTGDFYWDDVGDWAAMQRVLGLDEAGNAVDANLEGDNQNCVVFGNEKVIEMDGYDGLIAVDTNDALLVTRTEMAQDVKKLVGMLDKDEKLRKYSVDFVEKPSFEHVQIDCEDVSVNSNKLVATIGLKKMSIEETDEKIVIKNV